MLLFVITENRKGDEINVIIVKEENKKKACRSYCTYRDSNNFDNIPRLHLGCVDIMYSRNDNERKLRRSRITETV